MTIATITTSEPLNNDDLTKFVEQVTGLLKLSIVQGLNCTQNPQVYKFRLKELQGSGQSYPSTALVVAERFKQIPSSKINSVRLALGRDVSITSAIRTMGIDMSSEKSVVEQIDFKRQFAFVTETTFNESAMDRMVAGLSTIAESRDIIPVRDALINDLRAINVRYGSQLPSNWITDLSSYVSTTSGQISLNKGVRFRVHEVKCIDETDPEWAGSDSITWGGTATDDKGRTSIIPERLVGSFDDGDQKIYSPPEIIKSFSLDNAYPKQFAVVMTIAEKDGEGMGKFISELYQAVKKEVEVILAVLGGVVGGAVGTWLGAYLGPGAVAGAAIGTALGVIISIAAAKILNELVGWISFIFMDDIFPTANSVLTLNSPQDTFIGGSLVSPRMSFHYRDHGGYYRVTYDWEIRK